MDKPKMPYTIRCPRCGTKCKRHSRGSYTLRGGEQVNWGKYWCGVCEKFFTHSEPRDLVYNPRGRGHQYSRVTVLLCLQKMEEGWTYARIRNEFGVPSSTMLGWWKKKMEDRDRETTRIETVVGIQMTQPRNMIRIESETGGEKPAGGSQPPDRPSPPVKSH